MDLLNIAATSDKLINKRIGALLSEFDHFPVDHSSIPQARLDLVNRYRTSLFPWRGQFSPEFIELMLTEYTSSDSVVADPFVGSGTTLFEAARKSLTCFGAEINPAAVVMARTVRFVNLELFERESYIRSAQTIIEKHLPIRYIGDLFSSLEGQIGSNLPPIEDSIKAMLREASREPLVYAIIANTIIQFMESDGEKSPDAFFYAFKKHRTIIEQLSYSQNPSTVFHCDARALPFDDDSIDFIVTSPPYINVFNYHQNYRPAMELMAWNILTVARSEFGSNRKNRGNRFLTVVQYTIDMLQALLEMRRIIRPSGRIVIVIGRESAVRGFSFQNGKIVAALAVGGANLRLDIRQERKFKTRFGKMIYEDILHFVPSVETPPVLDNFAYCLAQHILSEAVGKATDDVRTDILAAIHKTLTIQASPYFSKQQLRINHERKTSSRQVKCGTFQSKVY